jgi:serine/threonine protein kinase
MDQDTLQKLYGWFEQLIELPPDEESLALRSLRKDHPTLVLHLECLLASARNATRTSAAFDVQDILDAAQQTSRSDDLSQNIEQLARELQCDPVHQVYRVGDFLLKRCLSVSKLGITYYAHDSVLDRDVVLMLAMPNWRSSPPLRKRFVDSARVVAKLFHPNVASILGTLESQGQFLILRQWIDGTSLHDTLLSGQRLTFDQSLQIACGICEGLQALHRADILHGDLKPANIILRRDSQQPVITDFGTSLWLGDTQNPIWKGGTPGYIAPEILQGQSTTKSADLFSLGIVFQQLFPSKTTQDPRVDAMIQSLTAESPHNRPSAIDEVIAELQTFTTSSIVPGVLLSENLASKPNKSNRLSRRNWMLSSLELPLLAGASTSLAYLATRSVFSEPNIPSPYVPGIETNHKLSFLLQSDSATSAITQIQTLPPLDPSESETSWIAPKLNDRWIHLESTWQTLPDFEVKANLVMVAAQYDTAPRFAKIQIDYRYKNKNQWNSILKATNTFGGPYIKHYHLSLPNSTYMPNQSLQFRVSILHSSTSNPHVGPIPIMINLRQKEMDNELVRLLLWDRLMYRADRSDKVEV